MGKPEVTSRRPPRVQALALLATGLAVLLGVGLGAGPVTERTVAQSVADQSRLRTQVDKLQHRADRLAAEASAADTVVAALSRPLVGQALHGRTVVVVVSPRAARSDVRRARAALSDAGATVVATAFLTDDFADPALAQSPLEDLALRLVPPGVEFAEGATAIERVAAVLAGSLVVVPAGDAPPAARPDRDAAEVIAGLDELDALRLAGPPGVRAELAVLVTGNDPAAAEPALIALARALDAAGRGTVVAGPGDASAGPLRWVRDARAPGLGDVASIDHAGTTAGRVALALALAEQLDGGSGAYGTGRRADAVIPQVGAGARAG